LDTTKRSFVEVLNAAGCKLISQEDLQSAIDINRLIGVSPSGKAQGFDPCTAEVRILPPQPILRTTDYRHHLFCDIHFLHDHFIMFILYFMITTYFMIILDSPSEQ
jgi:hypothetical protein